MKEIIEEFCDMIERDAKIMERELKECSKDMVSFHFGELEAYQGLMRTEPYQALKAVLSMPVSEDKPELFCDCNLPGCLYCASDHKERVKEQPTDTQDNDGWIKHDGLDMPYPLSYQIEIEMRDGARIACQSKDCLWEHEGANYDIIACRIIDEPKAQECKNCGNPKPGQIIRCIDGVCAICKKEIVQKEPKKQTLLEFIESHPARNNTMLKML